MNISRIKPEDNESAVYHCTCRTVFGTALAAADCEEIRDTMWRLAAFHGVEVLTYSVLPRKFQVLVRVPPVESVSDEELVRRKTLLYGESAGKDLERALADRARAKTIRAGLFLRMHDLSFFFKELKLRVTLNYNRRHKRFGTLWAERFSSLLIENRAEPLMLVANYIDLSPIRNRLCADPKDYPFSGYGEAIAGGEEARAGIRELVGKGGWQTAAREYRSALLGQKRTPSGPKREDAERCLRTGIAFGSAQFIEKVRNRFPSVGGRERPGKPAEWPSGDVALQFARRKRRSSGLLSSLPENDPSKED